MWCFIAILLCALCANAEEVHKIVNGNDALPKQFAHMAALAYKREIICGGSVIAEKFILTAAQCLENKTIDDITVILGSIRPEHSGIYYRPANFIIHPGYKSWNKKDDIALIEVSNKIFFHAYVQPIKLNRISVYEYPDSIISGWGSSSIDGEPSAVLKYLPTKRVGKVHCFFTFLNLDNKKMCVDGGKKDGICVGDEGSPLIADNMQIGIASRVRKPCGSKPDLYIRVDKYISWIRRHTRGIQIDY